MKKKLLHSGQIDSLSIYHHYVISYNSLVDEQDR